MMPQSGLGVTYDELPALPPLSGFHLAQVVEAVPINHALRVLLPSLTGILNGSSTGGITVHVMEHRAGVYSGDLDLPRKGDWGLVVFPHGSDQYPVWLGSLYQDFNTLATANPNEKISHHESGVWTKTDANGNVECAYPDGSYLRIGSGTALSARTRQRRQGSSRETIPYDVPDKPVPTVFFSHSSGTTFTIDPSGNLTISGAADVTVQSQQAGPHVHLGGTASEDFLAKLGGLAKIVAAFNAHTHGGVQGGAGSTAPPATPITLIPVTDYTQHAKAR
ncbi:MAG: phage baseplate assembly protein V [Nitrospirota bacterium]|nr:phage baseplate assembly protein V [Nitrospirota bacterium]